MNEIHSTSDKYVEKVQLRCRDRPHVSVLLEESASYLTSLGPDKLYVDCTFGRGGHSQLILSSLSKQGRLKAFDVDPLAVQVGQKLAASDERFEILHHPFGHLAQVVREPIAGVLLDLGVSSPQLDDRSRGFSVKGRKDGPLDLRMNQDVGIPASEWLQSVDVGQLAWVIRNTCYELESPIPERIAEAILNRQTLQGPYTSTVQLVNLLESFSEDLRHEHPSLNLAHIVFCAIRIFLNQEMEQLDLVLEGAFERLELGGRCAVICFNRWEVAAVRRFLRSHEEPGSGASRLLSPDHLLALYPGLSNSAGYAVRMAMKPVVPTPEEHAKNPRATARLYVLEKIEKRLWPHLAHAAGAPRTHPYFDFRKPRLHRKLVPGKQGAFQSEG